MTTNHRPTLESKRGKVNSITDTISHSRALPQQTTLKYREDGSKVEHKKGKRALEELKTELLIREGRLPELSENDHISKRIKLKENHENLQIKETEEGNNDIGIDDDNEDKIDNKSDEDGDVSNDNEGDDIDSYSGLEDSESDDEGDSEDETELLLAELAKIRQERQEEKERVEEQAKIDRALLSNPLVSVKSEDKDKIEEAPKKKSWRLTTTFSNRPNKVSEQDTYTNDTLRSKHHQNFLNKFVR